MELDLVFLKQEVVGFLEDERFLGINEVLRAVDFIERIRDQYLDIYLKVSGEV
jgi:hypothetical protein